MYKKVASGVVVVAVLSSLTSCSNKLVDGFYAESSHQSGINQISLHSTAPTANSTVAYGVDEPDPNYVDSQESEQDLTNSQVALMESIDLGEVSQSDTTEFVPRYEIAPFSIDETTAVKLGEYTSMVNFRDTVIEFNAARARACFPADGYVTSNYGWRRNRMHSGIDIKAFVGDNIYAAFDGVVRLAKYYSAYGYCVVIRHYNGLETLYAHNSKLLVKPNDHVKAGDVIAFAGNTGRSTGSHLHFEVRVNGQCINPNLVIDTESRSIEDKRLYLAMRGGKIYGSNSDDEAQREAEIMAQASVKYHIVRSGDVLSRIAVKHHTTVTAICRMNGISSRSTLRIGQRLKVREGIVPPKTATASASKQSTASPNQTTPPKSTATASTTAPKRSENVAPIAPEDATYHIVKSGDTLSQIAQKYNTTVTAICRMNGISSKSTLRLKQRLIVGKKGAVTEASKASTPSTTTKSTSTPVAPESAKYHIIKQGDTLSALAAKYNTTVSKICEMNGISSRSMLRLGQKVIVGVD
ncbi:MAG: LysM peptidoglycan-binding domain-containing protein [Rikenellaceae bacterium]